MVRVVYALRPRTRRGAGWHEARYLTGTPFGRLAVEDLDPYRDCQDWPATARLGVSEWLAWQRALAAAGQHLASTVPAYADAIAAGLRAVVPLRSAAAGRRSATARQAFGALAVALPAGTSELSALLIHEFQHIKLSALLDLAESHRAAIAR